jgi:hypothetical protein
MDDETNSDLEVGLYAFPGLATLAQDKLCGTLKIEDANCPIYGLSFKTILQEVSAVFEISEDLIKGKKREHAIICARTAYFALAKQLLPAYTLAKIGKYVKRDHSTVLHNWNKHNNWMEVYPEYADLYKRVEYRCSKYFIYEVDNNSSK